MFGTGQAGRHVVEQLVAAGADVGYFCLDAASYACWRDALAWYRTDRTAPTHLTQGRNR